MRLMKTTAWFLVFAMLLCFGASAEKTAVEVPAFSSSLQIREIGTPEEAIALAKEFWQMDFMGEDISVLPDSAWSVSSTKEEGYWHVIAEKPDGTLEVQIEPDGTVSLAANRTGGWTTAAVEDFTCPEEPEPEEVEKADILMRRQIDARCEFPFLASVNPSAYREYVTARPDDEDLTHYEGTFHGSDGDYNLAYSEVYASEALQNERCHVKFVVQYNPVVRIVFFDPYCSTEEGGNG